MKPCKNITFSIVLLSFFLPLMCSENKIDSYTANISNWLPSLRLSSSPEENKELTLALESFEKACTDVNTTDLTEAIRKLIACKQQYYSAHKSLARRGLTNDTLLQKLCDSDTLCKKAHYAFLFAPKTGVEDFWAICKELRLLSQYHDNYLSETIKNSAQKVGANKKMVTMVAPFSQSVEFTLVALAAISSHAEESIDAIIENKPEILELEAPTIVTAILESCDRSFHNIRISQLAGQFKYEKPETESQTKQTHETTLSIAQKIFAYLTKRNKLSHETIHHHLGVSKYELVEWLIQHGYKCTIFTTDTKKSSLDIFITSLALAYNSIIRPTEEDMEKYKLLTKHGAQFNAQESRDRILTLYTRAANSSWLDGIERSHHLMQEFIRHQKQ